MEAIVCGDAAALCSPDLFSVDGISSILRPELHLQDYRRKKETREHRSCTNVEIRVVSRRMLEHSWHVRLEANRNALEAIARGELQRVGRKVRHTLEIEKTGSRPRIEGDGRADETRLS